MSIIYKPPTSTPRVEVGGQTPSYFENRPFDANQSGSLAKTKNFPEMRNFLKTVGSNRQIINQKLIIEFQKPWELLCKTTAEARRAEAYNINNNSTNSTWWSVLDNARTHFQHKICNK